MSTSSLFAQQIVINEGVTSPTGEAISGANFLKKGIINDVITDIDGNFY
jgi:hypothetical protein